MRCQSRHWHPCGARLYVVYAVALDRALIVPARGRSTSVPLVLRLLYSMPCEMWQLDSDEANAHRGQFVDKHRKPPTAVSSTPANTTSVTSTLGDSRRTTGGRGRLPSLWHMGIRCTRWRKWRQRSPARSHRRLATRPALDHSVNSNIGCACSTQAGANIAWSCFLRKRRCIDYTTCATNPCGHARRGSPTSASRWCWSTRWIQCRGRSSSYVGCGVHARGTWG